MAGQLSCYLESREEGDMQFLVMVLTLVGLTLAAAWGVFQVVGLVLPAAEFWHVLAVIYGVSIPYLGYCLRQEIL